MFLYRKGGNKQSNAETRVCRSPTTKIGLRYAETERQDSRRSSQVEVFLAVFSTESKSTNGSSPVW
jgi:hypothetical protein